MNNRLSHSAINKYLFCGEAFRLHYREGYRPKTTSSALLFGKALDKAFDISTIIGTSNTLTKFLRIFF